LICIEPPKEEKKQKNKRKINAYLCEELYMKAGKRNDGKQRAQDSLLLNRFIYILSEKTSDKKSS